MLTVLSPAKTLDLSGQRLTKKHTLPEFLDDSEQLIETLARKSNKQIASLMNLSDKLAALNVDRYKAWHSDFTVKNSKPALLTFKGDVYQGFEFDKWKAADFTFAQKHLRILSGLHGSLRPLDLIQPYRLEMGTKLKTKQGKDLYDFWGKEVTFSLIRAIKASKSNALINLASNEYFKVVHERELSVPIVTPVFQDEKNGKYKVISFFAKNARGMMAEHIIRNRITDPAGLMKFKSAGYRYAKKESSETTLVFRRKEQSNQS